MKRHISRAPRLFVTVVILVVIFLGGDPGAPHAAALLEEDEYKVIIDGKEVETAVPGTVKGRFTLVPADVLARHLGVSVKWTRKEVTLSKGNDLRRIKIDGGRKGADLREDIPRIPQRILRHDFNITVNTDRIGEKIVIDTSEPFDHLKAPTPTLKRAVPGELAPDFSLPDLEGRRIPISSFRAKRVVIWVWASWDRCRRTLGHWQDFMDEEGGDSLQVIGVAIEPHGLEYARRYAKRAEVEYAILVDRPNLLSRIFGFRDVPTVILIDELGVYRKQASPEGPRQVFGLVRRFLREPYRPEFLAPRKPEKTLSKKELIKQERLYRNKLVDEIGEEAVDVNLRILMAEIFRDENKLEKAVSQMGSAIRANPRTPPEVFFRWGLYLLLADRRAEGILKFREAAKMSPSDRIVRTMIWVTENPERFYPDIDLPWQQLKRQKNE